MTRETALKYVGYAIDDMGKRHDLSDIPDNAWLVGWQCGFEPMFAAVCPAIVGSLSEGDAEAIAIEYLQSIAWFAGEPKEADYIL